MTVQERSYSVEDLATMPDDRRYELIEGVLVEMSPVKLAHGKVVLRLGRYIDIFVEEHGLGQATTETGYILSHDPDTVVAPDIAFISKQRLPKPEDGAYVPLAPDLAVEVVSPNDTADEVDSKVSRYLAAGTRLIWVVYPARRKVYVYRSSKQAQIVDIDGTLDGDPILPGFTLLLSEIFKELQES